MKKILMSVAIAGAFAAPGAALAQSGVTISGIFKTSLENVSFANTAKSPSSEMRVTDESSRIIFGVAEDLGGGLAAIGQVDMRFTIDNGTVAASGNTFVGLRSSSWGTLTIGRHDLHYGKQPDDIAAKAGSLKLTAIGLMDHAGGGSSAIAGTTRTPNVVRWDSPAWGGFTLTAAYSTAPFGGEGDIAAGATQKGSATNLAPTFTTARWQIGGSVWSAKTEATNAREEDGQVIFGYWRLGGWKIGAAVNNSEIKTAGVVTSDRQAWTIPVSYTTGAHNFYGHYTNADDDDRIVGDNGAKMFALGYVYDLSKRTTAGVGYAKITNAAAALYNFFASASFGGVLGSTSATVVAGEDPSILTFTIRHGF